MKSKAPVNIKELMRKSQNIQIADDFERQFSEDELQIEQNTVRELREEARRGAKVWMAAVKYVMPAATVSLALTDNQQSSDKIMSSILELSSNAAFANVVDAYSCGAAFNDKNAFGLYRYSLATASASTSLMALLTQKITTDFGKMIWSHLAEIASGTKPLSARDLPDDVDSVLGNAEYRKNLRRYANTVYPNAVIGNETQIATSIINALSRTLSNYQVRLKDRPETKRMEDVVGALVIDTMEKWIYYTKSTANGNVLNDVDDTTRIMVIQNALNLVSAIANSAIDRASKLSDAFIYSPNAVSILSEENEKLLSAVMKKTNAYASVFSKNESRIFDAIQDTCLGYDTPLNSELTPNGWMKLFELPNLLVKYLARHVVKDKLMSKVEISSDIDNILERSLELSNQIVKSLMIDSREDWAFKEVVEAAIDYEGGMSLKNLSSSTVDVNAIARAAREGTTQATQRGLGGLINSDEVAAINPLHSISVKYACMTLKLLSLLSGQKDGVHKFDAISKLNTLSINHAIDTYLKLQKGYKSIDSQVMELGCIINATNQIVLDAVRYELLVNPSSTVKSFIQDVIEEGALFKRIDTVITKQTNLISNLAEQGIARLSVIALTGENEKKLEAAVTESENPEQAAAMVL